MKASKKIIAGFKRNIGKNIFILCGLIPLAVWMFFFVFYPFVIAILYSFTNWTITSPNMEFIGMTNYFRFAKDRIFLIAMKNTLIAVITIVPFTIVFAFLLALAFNYITNFIREIYMPIYFLPSITSVVAIAAVWRWLYHPSYGLFNYFLNLLNIPLQSFLQNPKQALFSVLGMIIWQEIGYYAVILLAALKTLPKVFYEAATIDGAGSIHKFFYISIPLLTPSILFTSIMSIIGAFQVFVPINIMTRGGPGDATTVLPLYIYRTGVSRMDMGYATAISMILFVIIMLITIIQWKFIRADWEY